MTGEELRNADAAANSAVVGEGVKFERIRRIDSTTQNVQKNTTA